MHEQTPDPAQVIVDYLSSTGPPVPNLATLLRRALHGPHPEGGFGVDADTVCFLKRRAIPRRQVHAVRYAIAEGYNVQVIVVVAQDTAGRWHIQSITGGGGRCPPRTMPWVNLVGGGWPATFYAGGRVVDLHRTVARVRVIAANGVVIEDSIDDGLVLFLTDQHAEPPWRAELYDRTGQMLSHHVVLG